MTGTDHPGHKVAVDGTAPITARVTEPVGLPRLLVLTDRHQASRPLVDVVTAAVLAGVRAVVVREKDLAPDERRALVAALAPVLHDVGGMLLSAGEHHPGTDGVHQSAAGGPAPVGAGIVGRSCHDRAEVRRAEADGVDYVTVSPVHTSASKPGYGPALGSTGLASLVAGTTVPVFALGGIDAPAAVVSSIAAGAHGVAVMGAVMRDPSPRGLVAELVTAAEEAGAS